MRQAMILAGVLALAASAAAHAQSDQVAVLETPSGTMVLEFYDDIAPGHVDNFAKLAGEGFYDGTVFHRIIPGFMIQGGDPNTKGGDPATWGTGDPGYKIPAEFNEIRHVRGTLSMARSSDPDSAGSQFFIVHRDSPHLDGQYTAFGRLATQESFGTLDAIASLETGAADRPVDTAAAGLTSVTMVPRSEAPGTMMDGPDAETPPPDPQPPAPPQQGTPGGGPYSNAALGIAFDTPEDWTIRELPKQNPGDPEIIMQPDDPTNPSSITLTTSFAGPRDLDMYMAERNSQMQIAIEQGVLDEGTITPDDSYGREAFVLTASGNFTSGETTIPIRLSDVFFKEGTRFYSLAYTHEASAFDSQLGAFEAVVGSFEVTVDPDKADTILNVGADGTYPDGGACLIATAAYGTELAPQVQQLREIRADIAATQTGSAFLETFNAAYYSFSPGLADLQRQNPVIKEAVRLYITPMLATLQLMDGADTEAEVISYGIGAILLNLGMYVGAPGILYKTFRTRRKNEQTP